MRNSLIGYFLLIIGLGFLGCSNTPSANSENKNQRAPKSLPKYTGKVFRIQSEESYGYSISKDSKVIINQLFLPAMQGKIPIADSIQAKELMNIGLQKIVGGQFPPAFTQSEVLNVIQSK